MAFHHDTSNNVKMFIHYANQKRSITMKQQLIAKIIQEKINKGLMTPKCCLTGHGFCNKK